MQKMSRQYRRRISSLWHGVEGKSDRMITAGSVETSEIRWVARSVEVVMLPDDGQNSKSWEALPIPKSGERDHSD